MSKRILFITPKYLNLYIPIEKELRDQGYEVYTVTSFPPINIIPYFRNTPNREEKIKCFEESKYLDKYWKNFISSNNFMKKPFDILFCINGLFVNDYIISYLESFNPQIKKILYVWDSNRHCDFFRNNKLFSKVFSFDYQDCKEFPDVHFLSFYYPKELQPNNDCNYLYDICCIGKNHDGRLEIAEKIVKQLNIYNCKYLIKIYQPIANKFKYTIINILPKRIVKFYKKHNLYGKLKSPLITHEIIPIEEFNKIIECSRCILDTDRESQTGATPRLIWALAAGKKIITTNNNIAQLPFYNEKQIFIIDRNDPVIDINFIKEDCYFPLNDEIEKLRINNWIKIILH